MRLSFILTLLGLSILSGCASHADARALHSGADAPTFWAYVTAEDPDHSGIFRCYDADGHPICKRARMRYDVAQ
jgi:hypothetical protein